MIKISVIIPVYNAEMYLKDTLECLFNQTLKDIEVICINDNSKDSSLEILKKYAKKDDRLKIIDLKENMGAAVARNKGLEIAQGEYLGFVDSDDEIDLNFYEELYTKAMATGADIVKAGCKTVELDGTETIMTMNKDIEEKSQYYFIGEWWCAIYRAKLIFDNNILFPEECPKGQDCVFLNRAVLKANSVETVNDVFYHYIRRSGSLDSKQLPFESVKSTLYGKRIIADDINNSGLYEKSIDDYNFSYLFDIKKIFIFLFRSDDELVKKYFAETLIDVFHKCKNKKYLEENFPYPLLLDMIENKEYEKLCEFLIKCKNVKDLKYGTMTVWQNLFSIQKYGKYKLLTILGIRLKLK